MKLRAIAMSAATLAAGTALTILTPASPAVGFFSPPLLLEVEVNEAATLLARGAAVETRLEVTCAGATEASLDVHLTQRVGNEIASGFASARIGCSSQQQTVILVVLAQPGKAFKKGSGVADAEIFACAPMVCGSESDIQTVDIR